MPDAIDRLLGAALVVAERKAAEAQQYGRLVCANDDGLRLFWARPAGTDDWLITHVLPGGNVRQWVYPGLGPAIDRTAPDTWERPEHEGADRDERS